MGRPLKWSVERKLPLVLSILRGEGSVAEIGRRHQVSDATLAKWQDAFLSGGAAALANGSRRGQSSRETDLETELEEVKARCSSARSWAASPARPSACAGRSSSPPLVDAAAPAVIAEPGPAVPL